MYRPVTGLKIGKQGIHPLYHDISDSNPSITLHGLIYFTSNRLDNGRCCITEEKIQYLARQKDDFVPNGEVNFSHETQL